VIVAFLKSDLVQPARSLRTGVRRLILNGAPVFEEAVERANRLRKGMQSSCGAVHGSFILQEADKEAHSPTVPPPTRRFLLAATVQNLRKLAKLIPMVAPIPA
jgi:hypothetical protein